MSTADDVRREIDALRRQLEATVQEVQRLQARTEIEDLASLHQYLLSAGLGERIVNELWSQQRPDVSSEHGASGVFEGLEKVATYYQKDLLRGRFTLSGLTTPNIWVAPDQQTARGLWVTVGIDSAAGDLGPTPPVEAEERSLLSSQTADGRRFRAEWVWEKMLIDAVRDDGQWRIWHLHIAEVFRTPFDEDWLSYSQRRFDTDGLRLDALYRSNLPFPPGAAPENNASAASTGHWQLTVDALPTLFPVPPSARPPEEAP